MLEEYIRSGGIELSSQLYLFHPIASSKFWQSGYLTYSQLRELLKNKLEELGYPSTEFGVHSLRTGEATVAAERCISDRLFNKHAC